MICKRRNGVILRAVEPIQHSEAPEIQRWQKREDTREIRLADVPSSMEIAFESRMNHGIHGYQKSIEQIFQSFLGFHKF